MQAEAGQGRTAVKDGPRIKGTATVKFGQVTSVLALIALVAGCGSDEEILPGERLGVREALGLETAQPDPSGTERAISLPAPQAVADMPQLGGNPEHLTPHAALSAQPARIWSTSIGAGNSRRYRITAPPVVAGGVIYTLDARSQASAVSADGKVLWKADLRPDGKRGKDVSGGGLAYGDGRLFATTGYGTLIALDPATGDELWTQKADAAISAPPTYREGMVYFVSRDNRAWAISATDGRVQWQIPGTPAPAAMLGGAAPAVTERLAIFPFSSADLVAALRQSGVRVWGTALAGQRRGAVYAAVTDITGDPVVAGNVLYAGNQSGRSVALDVNSGERIWTAEDGAYGAMLPVGGSVFFLTDQDKLVRLDASDGSRIWSVDLPYFTKKKPKKLKAVYAHYGPILAGGRIWLASDDGWLRGFDPASGALLAEIDLPGGAASRPVVAGGTLYVLSERGELEAFR